jgi:Family of unknown function (DUF6220)
MTQIVDAPTRSATRTAFEVMSGLLIVAVVVQFYFAAFGVFTAPENDSQFVLHTTNGRVVLPLLCILTIVSAAVAKAPGRLIGFSALPLGLLVCQTILFIVAGITGSSEEHTNVGGQIILGLHAVNGLAILATSIVLFRRARAHAGS